MADSHIPPQDFSRRRFIRSSALLSLGGILGARALDVVADTTVNLPFANGERSLAAFPQKRELLLLRTRPPLLETPFSVFDQGVFTPNDAFFVRWHLVDIPTEIDTGSFRLSVRGHVKKPLALSLKDLATEFEPVETAAVLQCTGNSRGFFAPRTPGAQWGHGAMGNAMWTGVRLKDILSKAGVAAGAVQVRFNGLDQAVVPETPDFMKSLDVDHASAGEVMVAYAMNGQPLPLLNGFPLRLVVPGWYSTFWVKMLSDIEVLDKADDSYWMSKAYRVPDNDCACTEPGGEDGTTKPITAMTPRSFITSLSDGAQLPMGRDTPVRGIAFGGNAGIERVDFSSDGGKQWVEATLGKDHGKYSFRLWQANFTPTGKGSYALLVRTTNTQGRVQPAQPIWNSSGNMQNVVEIVKVDVI